MKLELLKSGGVALVFGAEQRGAALQLFEAVASGNFTELLPSPKTRTLEDVKKAVSGGVSSVRLAVSKPIVAPVNADGLSNQHVAAEILAILFEKAEKVFGDRLPMRLRAFYTEAEQHFMKPIDAKYRELRKSADTRTYPSRKIDVALTYVDSRQLLEFAKAFEYNVIK